MAPSSGELWGHHLMPQVCNSPWHNVPEQQSPSTDGPGGLPASQWCHCASSMSKVRTLLLHGWISVSSNWGLVFSQSTSLVYKGITCKEHFMCCPCWTTTKEWLQLSCISAEMNHWGYWTGIGINGVLVPIRESPLETLKSALWREAQNYPLFHLLQVGTTARISCRIEFIWNFQDAASYIFVSITQVLYRRCLELELRFENDFEIERLFVFRMRKGRSSTTSLADFAISDSSSRSSRWRTFLGSAHSSKLFNKFN